MHAYIIRFTVLHTGSASSLIHKHCYCVWRPAQHVDQSSSAGLHQPICFKQLVNCVGGFEKPSWHCCVVLAFTSGLTGFKPEDPVCRCSFEYPWHLYAVNLSYRCSFTSWFTEKFNWPPPIIRAHQRSRLTIGGYDPFQLNIRPFPDWSITSQTQHRLHLRYFVLKSFHTYTR